MFVEGSRLPFICVNQSNQVYKSCVFQWEYFVLHILHVFLSNLLEYSLRIFSSYMHFMIIFLIVFSYNLGQVLQILTMTNPRKACYSTFLNQNGGEKELDLDSIAFSVLDLRTFLLFYRTWLYVSFFFEVLYISPPLLPTAANPNFQHRPDALVALVLAT